MLDRLNSLKGKVLADDMTRHGSLMVAFALLAAVFSWLFQVVMGRMLSPGDYIILGSLTSILLIVGVLSGTIDTAVTKFVSKERARQNLGGVNYLWRFFLKRTFLLGIALFFILAAFTPFIVRFLHIDNYWYPIILFSSLVLGFVVWSCYGTMRGLQRFWAFGITGTLWAFLKFAIAIGLVYLGLGLSGGLLSFVIAYAIVFVVAIFFLRDLARAGNEKVEVSGLRSYAGLVLLAILAFTVLTNIDVVLAGHYLSPADGGNYYAISVLGKIALFVPGGIAIAMFPKTSELFESGFAHGPVLRKAMFLTLLLSGAVVIVYWLSPEFIVNLLYGGMYPSAAPYLFKYGLAMLFFALSSLLMYYFLSLNRTKIAYFLAGAMGLELCLLALFHSSITQIVNVMLISGGACLVLMLPLYLKVRK